MWNKNTYITNINFPEETHDFREPRVGVRGLRRYRVQPPHPPLSPKSFAEYVFEVENETGERFGGEGAGACGPLDLCKTTRTSTPAAGNWALQAVIVGQQPGCEVCSNHPG